MPIERIDNHKKNLLVACVICILKNKKILVGLNRNQQHSLIGTKVPIMILLL
jgi:hypothetical protein